MLLLWWCVLLFLTSVQEIESKCTKITHFENGLPSTIKRLDPNDYPGGALMTAHSIFRRYINMWPEYLTSSNLCNTLSYRVAKAVAKFLIFYHQTGELRIENIHLTGISLGGPLASYIAKELAKFKKVARFTGLDSSAPFYKYNDHELDISKDDAEFIDIIHSSPDTYGLNKSVEHADFYLNYRPVVKSPVCNISALIDRGEIFDFFICDHILAIRLFVQTVANPHLFPVCKNVTVDGNFRKEMCGYFGYAASKSTTVGDYFFSTDPSWDIFKELESVD